MEARQRSFLRAGVLVAIVLAAVGVRAIFADRQSLDYLAFLRPWYDHIAGHGGIFALRDRFADYNYPYLYLLALLTYLHIPSLIGIKAISVVLDVVLAAFVHRIVAQRHPGFGVPTTAFAIVLFLPTVDPVAVAAGDPRGGGHPGHPRVAGGCAPRCGGLGVHEPGRIVPEYDAGSGQHLSIAAVHR